MYGIANAMFFFLLAVQRRNKENSRLRSNPTLGCALAGIVVAGSALMPIGNGDVRFVLLFSERHCFVPQ